MLTVEAVETLLCEDMTWRPLETHYTQFRRVHNALLRHYIGWRKQNPIGRALSFPETHAGKSEV